QHQLELYRARMTRAYSKNVRARVFKTGELVLALRRPMITKKKRKGKFEEKWEGPYVIEKAYEGGAYQLVDSRGNHPMPPVNGCYLKKYYAEI
ncbi:hypothetical protein L8N14_017240, partial [Serratia marcescens]|nr:hypothetical protein [Serratia marcescens]